MPITRRAALAVPLAAPLALALRVSCVLAKLAPWAEKQSKTLLRSP